MGILSFVAISEGKIKRSSLEVLSHARKLAEKNGMEAHAVIADEQAASYADEIKKFGVSKIYTVESPLLNVHINKALIEAIAKVIEQAKPKVVAFASTEAIKDVLGAVAARTGAGVISDASSFDLQDGTVKAQRPIMATKFLAETESDADLVLVSVRSGSYDVSKSPGDAEAIPVELDMDEGSLKQKIREIISTSGDKIDLSEAEIVVAAGRGVKDEEGKKLVEELSEVLGAAIGASRSVVETGMFSPTTQIGQTGKVVSPQLYIAVGISGAIQHVSGMSNSKVIVAINKDPDAPIFDIATYGLVGDLYKILPLFIEQLKELKSK
ncbi:MAG: electron transfer flavoprotein subunit alpha/FixB family protein [Balneolales bacterium]